VLSNHDVVRHATQDSKGVRDDRPQTVHVQPCVQVREVEGLVHLVGPDPVRKAGEVDAGFCAEDTVRAVLVKDSPPGTVDIVDGRLAEHRCLVAREAV
jgi:hypothetical protein